jgi:hypothetical protein
MHFEFMRRRVLFRSRAHGLRYRPGDSIAARRKAPERLVGCPAPAPPRGYDYPEPDPLAPHDFRYRALDQSKQQIRLCKIESRSEVKCKLKHFDFNATCPKYVALSYTWGEATPEQTIELNGYPFEVRQNLWDYMTKGIHSAYDWIWIDHICIDQDHIFERNSQVDLMADIYSRAEEVLVWLGEEGENTLPVMKYLHRTPPLPGYDPHEPGSKGRRQRPPRSEIVGLVDLFSRPYWSRLWVTQEIVRAQNVILCCGGAVADMWHWDRIMVEHQPMLSYWVKALQYSGDVELLGKAAEGVDFLALCRLYAQQHVRTNDLNPLGPTLSRFSQGECDDLRDKIFGLQGMVRQDQRVRIDYSKTPEEVYIDAAKALAALSRWKEPSDGSCHELRTLRTEIGFGSKLLESFEEKLELAAESYADPEGGERTVRWTWDISPGDAELDVRWDRIMNALPWGDRSGDFLKVLTQDFSDTTVK